MLSVGQRFTLNGIHFTVEHVSPMRAYCVGKTSVSVTVRDRRSGTTRTFTAHKFTELDISPDTPLDLLREFEQKGYRSC